jgi:hypothetical protein
MMIIIYILAGLVLLFLVMAAMGPRSYRVSRSTTIDRSPAVVYNYAKYLKNQDEWGPWARRDPDMEHSYQGADGTVGFVSAWKGNKQVGQGEQEITGLEENKRIDSELRFLKPWKAESDAFLILEDRGQSTNVTWGFEGHNKTMMSRVMGLVMNMDKAVGKDFEEGLQNMKDILESQDEEE